MSEPIAVCLERISTDAGANSFVRCVALPGRGPGLRVDATGEILWNTDAGSAVGLCVTGDDRLAVYRPEDAVYALLERAGRSLEIPADKPVIVTDGDLLSIGETTFRVHVHGAAAQTHAPELLPARRTGMTGVARTAAAAAIIGSTMLGGCSDTGAKPPEKTFPPIDANDTPRVPPIEVRDMPPLVEAPDPPPPPQKPTPHADDTRPDDGADQQQD